MEALHFSLLRVAAPAMFARTSNRNVERTFSPSRKGIHWLARDR